MRGYLLDTNVISELRKPSCSAAVKAWSDSQPAEILFLSTVTLAEIRYGIERQTDPAFRQILVEWIDTWLRPWFSGRILEINEDVILEWRRMVARGKAQGITFSQPDLFIAAIAGVHDLCVVSRNVRDFEETGIELLNPWAHG
ncbi:MAG: type II toxin-antitoxin system VapC family toxin [Alphaproteobacteria bacterium GM202ARS2]|nr:type II toxin-antitoxin system VapC family toxin [Alphaproteobacteria bacterium GM202ARS2]